MKEVVPVNPYPYPTVSSAAEPNGNEREPRVRSDTGPLAATHCWCNEKLHSITYGDRDFLECPLHGTAYHEDAEKKARELFGN